MVDSCSRKSRRTQPLAPAPRAAKQTAGSFERTRFSERRALVTSTRECGGASAGQVSTRLVGSTPRALVGAVRVGVRSPVVSGSGVRVNALVQSLAAVAPSPPPARSSSRHRRPAARSRRPDQARPAASAARPASQSHSGTVRGCLVARAEPAGIHRRGARRPVSDESLYRGCREAGGRPAQSRRAPGPRRQSPPGCAVAAAGRGALARPSLRRTPARPPSHACARESRPQAQEKVDDEALGQRHAVVVLPQRHARNDEADDGQRRELRRQKQEARNDRRINGHSSTFTRRVRALEPSHSASHASRRKVYRHT